MNDMRRVRRSVTRSWWCALALALAAACGGAESTGPVVPVVPAAPDTIGPTIILQPYDSLTLARSFTLAGTVSDTSDVVTVAIARRSMACCVDAVDTLVRTRGRSVVFSHVYTLAEGVQYYDVMATDGKGNTRSSQIAVRSDRTPPELYVIAPWSVPGDSATISVNGHAAPEAVVTVAYSVNGGPSVDVGQLTGPLEPYPMSPRRHEFAGAFNVPVVGDSESVTIFMRDVLGNSASTLVHVRRRSAIEQIDFGGHGCFLRNGGTAYCWGPNSYGELGTGDTRPTMQPTPVVGNLRFRFISAGYTRTCGVTTDNVGYCWGALPVNIGQQISPIVAPDTIPGGIRFSTIAVGTYHACGVAVDASVYCWGRNVAGELGDGSTTDRASPVRVLSDVAFDSVSVGVFHSCALAKSGDAWCWGTNLQGALGIGSFGDTVPVTTPVHANPGHLYTSLQAAVFGTCGIEPGGTAFCWGRNWDNNFGIYFLDNSVASPVRPELPEPVTDFSRDVNGCAIGISGAAYCWGLSNNRRLGNIFYNPRVQIEYFPLPAAIGIRLHDIHTGAQTCARTADGALYCWGDPFMDGAIER